MKKKQFLRNWVFFPKLWFSSFCNFATKCCRPQIFPTISSVKSSSLSLKYQRFTTLGFKDIETRKIEFGKKTQFLKKQVFFHRTLVLSFRVRYTTLLRFTLSHYISNIQLFKVNQTNLTNLTGIKRFHNFKFYTMSQRLFSTF